MTKREVMEELADDFENSSDDECRMEII